MNADRGIPRGSAALHTPAGYARRCASESLKKTYLSVWRFGAQTSIEISCPWIADGKAVEVSCFYPASHPVPFTWDGAKKVLFVEMTEENSARIFRIKG